VNRTKYLQRRFWVEVAGLAVSTLAVVNSVAAESSANWMDSAGTPIRSGSGTCIRSGYWAPTLASIECDGKSMPPPPAPVFSAAPPAPFLAPPTPPQPRPAASPFSNSLPAPAVSISAESWVPLEKKTAKVPKVALYTYLLFGFDPDKLNQAKLIHDRYQKTLDAMGRGVLTPIGDLGLRKLETTHLFLIPCKVSSNCLKLTSYNANLSRLILNDLSDALSNDGKRMKLALTLKRSPGPFFISSAKPLSDYKSGERPQLMFIDFSSLPLRCIEDSFDKYRMNFLYNSVELQGVTDLGKLKFVCSFGESVRAIADTVPLAISSAFGKDNK
jgi:hypothetical protein